MGPSRPFQLPPLSSPGTVRSQETRPSARTGADRLRHRPLGRRATTRGHADERRLPRTASPPESARRCWPEANDLQTPSVPGTQGPRTSATPASRAAGGRTPLTPFPGSRLRVRAPTPPCGRVGGSPRMLKRGRQCGPSPPAQRDCRSGREDERAPAGVQTVPKVCLGWKPRRTRCCRHTHLRPHIYPPRSIGVEICVQRLTCTEVAGGERFCMGKCKFVFFPYKVGRFFSPSTDAIRDLVVFTRGVGHQLASRPPPSRSRAASPCRLRSRRASVAARQRYRR